MKLSAGLVAEIACGAHCWDDAEREINTQLLTLIGGETAFFAFEDGISSQGVGAIATVSEEARAQWPDLHRQADPVLRAALQHGGALVDADYLGRALQRAPYYEVLMRPVRGRATLIGAVALGGHLLAKVAVGRCEGSSAFKQCHTAALAAVLPTLALSLQAHRTPRAQAPAPRSMARADATAYARLTRREREVLDYLRFGYSNAQIALALGSQPRTVRNQLSQVYRKLDVATRAEAVAVAFGLGVHNSA